MMNIKHFGIILIGLFLLAGTSWAFKDIPPGHWAQEEVDQLSREGVVDGFADQTFRGNRYLSRYEMAVWLDRAEAMILRHLAAREKLARELAAEAADLGREIKGLKTLTK